MPFTEKLPRILKEPTGWVILVLVLGFFYVQWPTRVKTVETPDFYVQTLENGFSIEWEQKPELQSASSPVVWGLSSKGMSFLVQTDQLSQDFDTMVTKVAEQDRASVAGAVQDPLVLESDFASYAFFDAESRIQAHRWYVVADQWVKVSVLYKPSMESRVKRADFFLENAKPL